MRINQNKRLLSEEDHQFIKQLVLLDPTIYKTEIRDKIYQYSNSPPPSISISTISRTVRYRLVLHYGSTNPVLNGSIRIGILILDAM